MNWFTRIPSDERHESKPVTEGAAIHAAQEREEPPRLMVVYTAVLPRSCKLKVTCRTAYRMWMKSGEITQANGRWVLFDPDAPADKILDRELLPAVESLCAEILQADKAFRDSDPSEFTDTKGRTWHRS